VLAWAPATSLHLHAEQAVREVSVTADVQGRTSLDASTSTLVMTTVPDAISGAQKAVATIDYVASARTRHGGEVLLAVERGAVHGPAGVSDGETEVTFGAVGARGLGGQPSVAARWVGSGSRRGTIVFTLHASVPGTYVVPVRLILTAP
jgi:hypothetical protein